MKPMSPVEIVIVRFSRERGDYIQLWLCDILWTESNWPTTYSPWSLFTLYTGFMG
jgi:hypothetical protein